MGVDTGITAAAIDSPLLLISEDIVDGVVDYKNRPVERSTSGGWKSASFIIGTQFLLVYSLHKTYNQTKDQV